MKVILPKIKEIVKVFPNTKFKIKFKMQHRKRYKISKKRF